MEQLAYHWTDFMKFDISVFFENMSRKFDVSFITLARITGTLREDQYTFLIISRFFLE